MEITLEIINQYKNLIDQLNEVNYEFISNRLSSYFLIGSSIMFVMFIITATFVSYKIFDENKIVSIIVTNIVFIFIFVIMYSPFMIKYCSEPVYSNKNFEIRNKIVELLKNYPELTNDKISITLNKKEICIDLTNENHILYKNVKKHKRLWTDTKSTEIDNLIYLKEHLIINGYVIF